ncbi:MAG: hypothetical protein MMC33_009588 [Icmadophila ericetorum]|nr:hypothetical protein [Icmadophila ericetorum]
MNIADMNIMSVSKDTIVLSGFDKDWKIPVGNSEASQTSRLKNILCGGTLETLKVHEQFSRLARFGIPQARNNSFLKLKGDAIVQRFRRLVEFLKQDPTRRARIEAKTFVDQDQVAAREAMVNPTVARLALPADIGFKREREGGRAHLVFGRQILRETSRR